ncbi:hypothetical protein OS493_000162 [Desmophyllum pertusum]|uniref:Uncharacterized protein n=1 Tax=Desmophyllum pertusum TaxID=174260 RepID=A0A9X0A6H7_9CNID|nr:hypothetical protein OS493_000162 [Desmophyllum pertusum]
MDSFLSLDELHVSFPSQELPYSRMENEDGEEDCDLLRESDDERGINSHHRTQDKGEIRRSANQEFLAANYVVTSRERESTAYKLPSIRPASSKLKNGLKKGRNRAEKGEFSSIDVDDFSVWGKQAMVNARKDMKNRTNFRNNVPSPGPKNCCGGEKWENDVVVESCFAKTKSSDSADSSNLSRPRLSLGSYSQLHGRIGDRPSIFSPPVSPKARASSVRLPKKISRLIEMELSIIKGENINSTQRRRYRPRSESVPTQEKIQFYPNSVELRRSQDPSMPRLGKPVMTNAKTRNTKEKSKSTINTRRDRLPSSGPRRCSGGEKWETDSIAESCFVKKSSSDSPNSSYLKLDSKEGTQAPLLSEQKGFFTASPCREIPPRLSPKEFGDRPLFSPTVRGHQVQELPLDLPKNSPIHRVGVLGCQGRQFRELNSKTKIQCPIRFCIPSRKNRHFSQPDGIEEVAASFLAFTEKRQRGKEFSLTIRK